MKWLLLAALLSGCTIEVKPISNTKKKHYTHHIYKHKSASVLPSPTPATTPDPLSKLAPLIREKSED